LHNGEGNIIAGTVVI